MIRRAHRVRAVWLAWLLALWSIAPPAAALAQANPDTSNRQAGSYRNILAAGETLTLAPDAPPAPTIYGSFAHFGIAIGPAYDPGFLFQSLVVSYRARTPASSDMRLDVRASADGTHWTAWEVGLASGARATFPWVARFAQYRATLLGSARARPSIANIQLAAERAPARFSAFSDDQPVAPTWTLRATREGMVGHHTANGHRITKHDHFVSLPSWRALSPEGTTDYQVRITYNGRSAVAPVYDVGPWNAHDDYWNEQRERFSDLPQGWPEDHAAYFNGYNHGRAEKGKVRFPTAVDIGDGVWWDELGIKGDQATVEITFLWMGRDPLADPPPAPAPEQPQTAAPAPAPDQPQAAPQPAPEQPQTAAPQPAPEQPQPAAAQAAAPQATAEPPPPAAAPPQATAEQPQAAPAPSPPAAETEVDEAGPAFAGRAAVKWYDAPKHCGINGQALWTYTAATAADSENSGAWRPTLAAEGMYNVYAYIPVCSMKKANTTSAHYTVRHRDGAQAVEINQATAAGTWVLLGRFPFAAGNGGAVELSDLAGDSMRTLWFDAVKWVPAP